MGKLVYNKVTRTFDPVCGYKWGWSTINLMAGRTNSCHRVLEDDILDDDFSNFHNTYHKIETRKDMLANKWPGKGCEYCRDIEEAGGISDRIAFNSDKENLRYIPKEFKTQIHPVEVSPTILEVYFSNLCNLGCVYCHPRYSSVLENESKKFEGTDLEMPWKMSMDHTSRENGYQKRLESFWKWFKENSHTLRRYNILGGEPFFQPEFYQNLDYFEEINLPELDLFIFSNLKIKKDKLRKILERLTALKQDNRLRSVNIVCSIDCWGPQQEYVRTGLDIKSWEENFDMMVHEFPDIGLEMHGTMSCLTIKTMPDLVRKWKEWDKIRPDRVALSHNFCFNPSYYSPFIFGPGFYDDTFEELFDILKDNNYLLETMKGYQNRINITPAKDTSKVAELKKELEKNDGRRNSDYKVLFPWIK